MAVIHSQVEIARAPEDVFDYVVDMTNELKWNPGVQSMEKLTEGPAGAGTKYLAKWKQSGKIEVHCVEAERPRKVRFVNGGPIEVDLAVTLEATPQGTRLDARFDAKPRGLFRLVFPIFLMVMRRQEAANMLNLKKALERA
jgi:carbon monoxide dehydrogenase subunit G